MKAKGGWIKAEEGWRRSPGVLISEEGLRERRSLRQGECGLLARDSPSELPPHFTHLIFMQQGPVSVGHVCPENYADMRAPASSYAVLFRKDIIG
jgi:hypothetical protein